MAPAQLRKWLVLFSDEINLSDLDKYGEREEREGRDETRERQRRRKGGFRKTGEREGREGERGRDKK